LLVKMREVAHRESNGYATSRNHREFRRYEHVPPICRPLATIGRGRATKYGSALKMSQRGVIERTATAP
jgi:hypothetical protein